MKRPNGISPMDYNKVIGRKININLELDSKCVGVIYMINESSLVLEQILEYIRVYYKSKQNNDIHFELIVFGTHLSKLHGYTYDEIKSFGFKSKYFINIETFDEDNQDSISIIF